ncbi:MAG: RNA-directed DNA polymerase [Pseudoalteromonas sp.]|uniref:RNA-directed DNA polymerase n=1 Tax=Pseudoalteromonas sp. TaxID=53249 RepID=UPI000C8AA131|nr:RNA-directed DNA polymerase [Pseudoalteromonas sp.]MAD04668.1 RNA-directed DNA polymerase [Pseudoalteromonas sp.]|tara:strand:+ start:1336 stop:3150 length:1815 start_codon:yes stop_codon:yes gene_type:complete
MRTTDRFHIQRKEQLESVFNEPNLVSIWRKIVKKQLRSMDVIDLHDYYDFNYRIEERAKNIAKKVLSGRYKSRSPLIYKVEKKLGICRHLMLPNPSDALVLQAVVESISEKIRESEIDGKAYYSRDKHNVKMPHEVREPGDYEMRWTEQWKKFQKDILNFSEDYKYLVVTDLTNYFDNIGLRELRHVISSRVATHEVTLDFLFSLIEQLSWNPDYLPTSLKGLPTINLEAPRLLAHALLFEIDEILNVKTGGSFVRWMDDINFGVNDIDEACDILGSVNDILKSRGLALNLGKTVVYTAQESERHFLVAENDFLDNFEIVDKEDASHRKQTRKLLSKFKKHLDNHELQNWSKVTKRFLTTAGKLKTSKLLPYAISLFKKKPGIRANVTYYLQNLGATRKAREAVLKLLEEVSFYDDVTLFQLSKLLVTWEIKRNRSGRQFITKALGLMSKPEKPFDLYCYLWVAAKYARPSQILGVIKTKKSLWEHEPFLTRQVVSILPRIRPFKSDEVDQIISEQISIGPEDAASVAHSLLFLEEVETLDKKLKPYMFPDNRPNKYPVQKFLILLSLMQSETLRKKEDFHRAVDEHITDPWMKYWINEYYGKS